ncbi:hypothetical protein O181_069807, partial [Austropuccinia psidii MF-1]|nr:hypothetical protein [Austropuccinia psidii MF-1]
NCGLFGYVKYTSRLTLHTIQISVGNCIPNSNLKEKEQKKNFTIACALFIQNSRTSNLTITIVLDTGASSLMFNNKHFFENLQQDVQTNVATGCDKSTLISKGQETVLTATFLCNLIPKHEDHVTPNEIWYKSKPHLNKLKPFGCQAWVKIPKDLISNKFSPKAWDGILLGYENDASSYWILRTYNQKIIVSKHVIFDEEKFPSLPSYHQNDNEIFNAFPGLIQTSERELPDDQPKDNSHSIELIPADDEDEDSFFDALEQKPQQIRVIGPRHPTLISSEIDSKNILPFCRRQPRTNLIIQTCSIPNSFEEAMKSSNRNKWGLAIQKEILNINRINVWTLRNKKINDHPISSVWIFKKNRKILESLTFKNNGFNHIKTYTDADWGNNPIDRRSISGYTVSINSHLISWKSKKQQTVSHSTTKAEHKSHSDAAKETSWLINLINEIQLTSLTLKPILLNDNKGAIDLALCDTNHGGFKTKHMDIKFHHIRELLKNGMRLLKNVSTASMNADLLTKSVGKTILL